MKRSKIGRRGALILTLLGVLITVQSSPALAVTVLNVSVTQTGIAIPGATISITNSSGIVVHRTTTGSNGSAIILISTTGTTTGGSSRTTVGSGESQLQLPEGSYTATVTYGIFGTSSQSADFSVTGTDEETNVTFDLSDPGAALTGSGARGDVGGQSDAQAGDQGGQE